MSEAVGVRHEVQPLPLVRRPDATSREYGRPDGVVERLQVSLHEVEPSVPNRSVNLLSKQRARAALLDEIPPGRPQVALVVEAPPLAR
ncbi:MAG: hypothetical protein WA609_04875 [Terriglobales bacterium]